MLANLATLRQRKTGRSSSWDRSGRNSDLWIIPPGETAVLADIPGPAQITHIWMTQLDHYRECLIKITYDDAAYPSVLAPLGDFFCLGHSLVNSFQSALFSASTHYPYMFNKPCALNCYAPMPFAKHAKVELINESDQPHRQYFYVDYETLEEFTADTGYFHAEFRRANPFGGWGPGVGVNTPEADQPNKELQAWNHNYVILETQGRGHYIGCNLSITNFTGNWWGEGDDMIWVDGYHWPPDLHGTGSEDYFNQAFGMQPNAFLHNGSSIFEGGTIPAPEIELYRGDSGYQTSYVFHLENPVHFTREIKVTIEHGHANHLANEASSVAYWYAERPTAAVSVPPVAQRLPVRRDNAGKWIKDPQRETPGKTGTQAVARSLHTYKPMLISNLPHLNNRKTGRCSSWDRSGRNHDWWTIPAGEAVILADIRGPAQITHIWMTQSQHYRECLIKITYDDAASPSVLVPLGDFFGLGHSMVNSFESALFSASTNFPYQFDKPCALNGYAPMPFARRAVVELVNQSDQPHNQYFYVDYETLEEFTPDTGYLHAEFRRANPFPGWGPEIPPNTPPADRPNLARQAWENNYVILETQGRGHYIGCTLSVTNYTRDWWGEGDDMIWVDGYKWPPDLHGTGSEDYLGHTGGMHPSAFLHNGSSIFEGYTIPVPGLELWRGNSGYQASYVFHLENPVHFNREIKVTIEHGHANHLANEMSSVAYWYADKPRAVFAVPPVKARLPVRRDNQGRWLNLDQERDA